MDEKRQTLLNTFTLSKNVLDTFTFNFQSENEKNPKTTT